jgi:ABC-2 type transport system permease protein
MFKEIFLFELKYRRVRAATYVYFLIIFVLSFLTVTSPTVNLSGAIGQVKANAPSVIALCTIVFSFFCTIITSSVMGVAIVRDFDNNTEAIMFSTPIRKAHYLFGRFAGSMVVLILIHLGLVLGLMAGFAIGNSLPWDTAWHNKELLAFTPWHFIQPFLVFALTNIFTMGALFFMSGALWRNSIIIYTQGVVMLILYQVSTVFLVDLDLKHIAALIDPFGLQTFLATAVYWTPSEQNLSLVTLTGDVLINRGIWFGVGVAALFITYKGFSFNVVRTSFFKSNLQRPDISPKNLSTGAIPHARQFDHTLARLQQITKLSIFYFRMIWKEIPFIAIVSCGVLLLFVDATRINQLYGTSSYPTTNAILSLINKSFNLFFLILALFYSGELIWKERSSRFNLIMDVIPLPNFVGFVSKFISLLLIYSSILLILIFCGVLVQVYHGYYQFSLSTYLATLFSQNLSSLAGFTLLFFFIQALVNNKFHGFAICILFLVLNSILPRLGLEHSLWQFGSGTLGVFSDMNTYGHFVTPFVWLRLYWTGIGLLLFFVAILFAAGGAEEGLSERWRASKSRLTPSFRAAIAGSILLFTLSGAYIFYNTNVVNNFNGTVQRESMRAGYEAEFRQYANIDQPKIVECKIQVELYPQKRDFLINGQYYLKNKSAKPISEIHIQYNLEQEVIVDQLEFRFGAVLKSHDKKYRHSVYELTRALKPGDSVQMFFRLSFLTRGFVDGRSNTDIVYNGTFLNNSYLPALGYNKNFDLIDNDLRHKYGLKERTEMVPVGDVGATSVNLFGDDADRIRFEAIIGTEPDQIAIAPGYLRKQWKQDGRQYFQYEMDAPMANFFSIVSGRYSVSKEKWNGIDLEIYHHPEHTYNLNRMMDGMKDALKYYSENFGSFQYRQLRIMEFPRYSQSAQSFANTIPFSEGLGFILRIERPQKDLDMVYYLTAHETAHQWWGHQVMEAEAQGSAMLSESLSQYSALMVMKRSFPQEVIQKYLRYELDNYLKGRATERNKEQPLATVEKQPYVHYNKASLVFFALQDYIGENNLNKALASYNKEWAFREDVYPSSGDLLKHIRLATPDSLLYLVHDMFETITLFNNKAIGAVYEEVSPGEYDLTVDITAEKVRADSLGAETSIPLRDWIDVGVYSRNEKGEDSLVYLKKHLINTKSDKITVSVKSKPSRAGIDPLNKLIDKHADDNVVEVKKAIGIDNIIQQ